MKPTVSNKPRGAIALLALLGISAVVLMVMTTAAVLAAGQSSSTVNATATEQTFYNAEAGLNQGLYSLAKDPSSGTLHSYSVPAPTGFSTTVYVTPDNGFPSANPSAFQGSVKVVTTDSTGKVRTLNVKATTSSFGGTVIYGAQTDKGGIDQGSGGTDTVNGDTFSNGPISGSITIKGNATVADNATLDQQDAQQDSEFAFGVHAGSTFYTDTAQSFTAGATGTLNRFSLLLKRVGTNPPLLKWNIAADNGGKPATTYLGSSFGTIANTDVGTSFAWLYINVPTPQAVTAGTKYWLVLDTADSAGDHWVWGMDGANTYSAGNGYYTASWTNSSAVWTLVKTAGASLSFKTWLGTKYQTLSNDTVTGNASASNISGTAVSGDAYYQTITSSATVGGTRYPTDTLPQQKTLPITSSNITNASHTGWADQVAAACGSSCITSSYTTSTNLNPSTNTVNGGTLTIGTTYYYRIAAVTGSIETITSKEVSATPSQNGPNMKQTINLNWNPVGVSTYHIYRTTTQGVYPASSLVGSPTGNSFSDAGITPSLGTTTCLDTCLGWQKISGTLTIDSNLTLTGNVWVTADITMPNNSGTVKIDRSFGSKSVILLASGKINIGVSDPLCGSNYGSTNNCNPVLSVSAPTNVSGCTAGTHSYQVTFTNGLETGPGDASNQVTCTATNGRIALTNIPIGPSGTTARTIYRTIAGDTGSYKLLTKINDNTTTAFTDTTPDSSLGVAVPAANFLIVISGDAPDYTNKTACSVTQSITAVNHSTSAIFAAPSGAIDVKQGILNAAASYSLCLENASSVNFSSVQSSINGLFVPSTTQQPLTSVSNTWAEQ